MTNTGKENIINWIDGSGMFDKYARDYVKGLIQRDIEMKIIFDENDLNICPNCKQNVMTDDRYCKQCGQKISIDL